MKYKKILEDKIRTKSRADFLAGFCTALWLWLVFGMDKTWSLLNISRGIFSTMVLLLVITLITDQDDKYKRRK